MDIDLIRQAIQQSDRFAGRHANQEAANDDLRIDEIWKSICAAGAEIIEEYPDDLRGPSYLILSFSAGHPIHSVIAYPAKRYAVQRQVQTIAFLITTYRPDRRPQVWSTDYRTRMP